MGLFAVEDKSLGERPAQFPQSRQSLLAGPVFLNLKVRAVGNLNLNVVALFQF
jgi:hypothetical protein